MNYLFCVYLAVVFAFIISPDLVAFCVILALGLAAAVFAMRVLRRRHGQLPIRLQPKPIPTTYSRTRVFAICFTVVLLGSMLYWLAYYPGGFNLDAYGQWDQAHYIQQYNDWHPLMSTLLIQLSTFLCDSFAFRICVQIVLFSAAIALLLSTLNHYGLSPKLTLAIAIFTALNPAIGMNTICLTKDVQFTILLVLLLDALVRIYFTDGAWLSGAGCCLYVAVIAALGCLVRHNGFFYVAPALLLTMLQNKGIWRKVFYIAVITVLCVMCIKVPISQLLSVQPHEDPVGEAVGIPMAIMGNALVSDPDNLPDEVHAFLNTLATDGEWQEHYIVGEWDSCKWDFGGSRLLGATSPAQLLRFTLQTIAACPNAAYQSVRENTSIVWQPVKTPQYWVPEVYIEENDYGIESRPIGLFAGLVSVLVRISLVFRLGIVLWNTGAQIIMIMLSSLLARGKRYHTAAYLYVPLLIYDFGTMLLLAGPNQRYFYCNAVLFLPLIVCMLLGRGDICPSES